MLYLPGATLNTGIALPIPPSPATFAGRLAIDFAQIIASWCEVFTIKRLAPVYDSMGRLTDTANWNTVDSVYGDWQPLSGRTIREEQGLDIKSDAQVLVPTDTEVQEHDRIYRVDGTFEYVNYVRKYMGHWTILVTRTRST